MEKFFRTAIRRYYEVELPRNHAAAQTLAVVGCPAWLRRE